MSPHIHPLSPTDPLAAVWRALSDPTRRAMLDMLREGPRTTGMLAEAFPQSRYAAMKHLDVLAGAGLLVVRRVGRERWNHLNSIPLQLMYERWVRPYEATWAAPLVRFRDSLERSRPTSEEAKMSSSATNTIPAVRSTGITQVELEIPIAAAAERVWRALTEQVDLWWPRGFFASAGPLRMRFDARLGGFLYEEAANGGGVVWYTVIALDPGTSVTLAGHLTPAFGGPAQTILRLSLREQGDATILELSDAVFGNVGTGTATEEGWRALFENAFKNFVEGNADDAGR